MKLNTNSVDGISMPSIFIDGGNWSQLTPAARSLAVSMRFFSKPRPELDPEHGEWLKGEEFIEYLKRRNADYCKAEPSVLREFAGIGPRVYKEAIQSLIDRHFIECDADHKDYWRVMVWPRMVINPNYLNAKLIGEV